jgi:hypothetical protein
VPRPRPDDRNQGRTNASRPKAPAIRPPAAPPSDPDPQDVYDQSISEYEGDARRETEVEPGKGVTLSDVRSASPSATPPTNPAPKKAARRKERPAE